MRIQATRKMSSGIRQPFPRSGRLQAAKEPYGAAGKQACASSSQPTYGSPGLPMSGMRPFKQAQMYHSSTAARRSRNPTANAPLITAAAITNAVTNAGLSQAASTLGNK